jgi:hypothetical protein
MTSKETVMKHSHRAARSAVAAGAAVVVLAVPTALSAAARPPPPEPNENASTVIEVPVEIPVDDATAETVQIALAALVGAGLAGGAMAAHYRRRVSEPLSGGDSLDAELGQW